MKKWLVAICCIAVVLGCKDKTEKTETTARAAHEQLVEEMNHQVRLHPDSSPVRMRLVNALDSLGLYDKAIVQLDTLILADSLNNGLWFARAQLQERNRDTTSAISSYEKALQIYPSVDAQLSLANLFAEKGDKRSLIICQGIGRVAMDRETFAHCDFISGIYFSRTGQSQKAITAFDRCINNNYTYMEAYMEKGFVYFDIGKYNDALKVFEKAITVNNMYADAYYWKAKTHEAMGNKQEAVLDYQRALGLDKELKEARTALERLGA